MELFDRNIGAIQATSSVTIQWKDSTGPGGAQWVALIRHRHIVISIHGVTTEYHYIPPG